MADVVVFHHAHGLTPGVLRFADQLRAGGHRVTAPDLFEGKTFDTLEVGVAYAEEVGFDTIIERGRLAAEGLPVESVYAGFSLGVLPAQMLAQTRAGAKGALLFHSCVPTSEFGGTWAQGVPVQIHAMEADPIFSTEGDLDAARRAYVSLLPTDPCNARTELAVLTQELGKITELVGVGGLLLVSDEPMSARETGGLEE